MRKTALLLAIILILSMPLSAAAAPRSLEVEYTLDFSGTTAICEATVTGERPSDYVEVLLKLMHGPYCVGTWYDSSNYYVDLQGTTTVIKGDTYKLVVEVTINGVKQEPVSVSEVC